MKLRKETYIHNQLVFNEVERDTLCSASKIITSIRQENESEDIYLNALCEALLHGISELLDNYANEYPTK